MEKRLGFIGAGNMSGAILGGVLRSGLLTPNQITVSNRSAGKLARLANQGVHTTADNTVVVRESDLIILGIKPQMFADVLPQIAPVAAGKCVVSISPGYSLAYLCSVLPGAHVVRAMPNTPLLVGKGCTAVAEAPGVPDALFCAVREVFAAAGEVFVLPEALLGAVIGAAGSSPAFFFRMADVYKRQPLRALPPIARILR